jgi:hypothetical protein
VSLQSTAITDSSVTLEASAVPRPVERRVARRADACALTRSDRTTRRRSIALQNPSHIGSDETVALSTACAIALGDQFISQNGHPGDVPSRPREAELPSRIFMGF